MCFVTWLSLDACPHPWLSHHPPLLHSHAGTGTRARVFLWWFPAVLWALVRRSSVTKGLWPVKEEATWAILVMTPESKECYSKIHIKYCWMSWGSLTQLEKVWHVPSIDSPWPDGDLKSPGLYISMNCTVTQGLNLPKSWKMLGIHIITELWGNLDTEDTWAWEHQSSYSSWLKYPGWHRIVHFPWICIKGKGRMPSQLSRGKEKAMLFCVLTLGPFPYLLSPGLSKEITLKSGGLHRVCSILKEKLCNFFPSRSAAYWCRLQEETLAGLEIPNWTKTTSSVLVLSVFYSLTSFSYSQSEF